MSDCLRPCGLQHAGLLCSIEWIKNKVLLYSTRNYIQYPEINHMEKNIKKCNHSVVQQKLTHPCKSAMLQLKILCILNMCPQVRVDSISDEIMKLSFWGGPVVKNPPCNAGDTGSIPGQERSTSHGTTKPMSHDFRGCALEPSSRNQRSLCAQSPCSTNRRSHRSEKPSHGNLRVAPARHSQRKACAQQPRPNTAKNNYK